MWIGSSFNIIYDINVDMELDFSFGCGNIQLFKPKFVTWSYVSVRSSNGVINYTW